MGYATRLREMSDGWKMNGNGVLSRVLLIGQDGIMTGSVEVDQPEIINKSGLPAG